MKTFLRLEEGNMFFETPLFSKQQTAQLLLVGSEGGGLTPGFIHRCPESRSLRQRQKQNERTADSDRRQRSLSPSSPVSVSR